MFLGHFAVGLAMKRVAPRTSLGTFTAAVEWLDLVWPILPAVTPKSGLGLWNTIPATVFCRKRGVRGGRLLLRSDNADR
jgi:hypothetical protein